MGFFKATIAITWQATEMSLGVDAKKGCEPMVQVLWLLQ